MKYKIIVIAYLVVSMIGSIYAQDNIINEIAKGGKFIVRDVEQNEAMVIEDGNVGFTGTLKLGVLPKGDIGNPIVVWDPEDKLLKILDQSLRTGLTNKFKDESWSTLGSDRLADDNITTFSASVQSTTSTLWTESGSNIYRNGGRVGIGTTNPEHNLEVRGEDSRVIVHYAGQSRGGIQALGLQNRGIALMTTSSYDDLLFGYSDASPTSADFVTRMVINNGNGRVGIGTTNPSAKLDVVGQVKIRGGLPGSGKVLTSDASGLATWQSPGSGGGIPLWTESGSNLYRTSGNIGIGTSNPSAKLEVAGQVKITGGAPGSGKVLTSDATGLATWQTPAAGGEGTVSSTLWTESGSNIYRNGGRVGIGTTNPEHNLEVRGEDSRVIVHYAGQSRGGIQALGLQNRGIALMTTSSYDDLLFGYSDASPTSADFVTRMVINNGNGRVGIGTTNPSAKLDVVGQVKIRGGLPGSGKVLTSDASGLATWQSPGSGGGIPLWTESGSNLYRTSGNIGIGTSNPNVKLDVNGSAIIGDNTSSSFLHVGDNYNSTASNSINPGIYVYKNGLISYGLKLQWTGSEYGTMMFGPNSANRFLSFGKVGSALEDDDMIEYMRIDLDNGNVGIGTTNPSAKLDVIGQVKIRGGSPGSGKVLTSDATGLATWQTPAAGGGSTLWTESGSNIYRTNGKVGIGTSSPTYNLDVNGTASAKRYVVKGIYNITSGVWDLSQSNLAQITYNSSITPLTINSDGSVGTYILVVKKNNSCSDCNITFSGVTVKYPGGVNPSLSSGSNTTDIFSFIAVGNNTFYCVEVKNLK